MSLIYKNNYWDDISAKLEFIKFLKYIHNLDLTLWDEKNLWDFNYQPFSFFDDRKIVSSVCLYTIDMMIMGERKKVAQISGVGTLPEHRRKGLNLELTQKVFEYTNDNHEFYYLFADEEALPFYKRCGFRTVDEYKTEIKIEGHNSHKPIKQLDINKQTDFDLIYDFAQNRLPVSDKLGSFNEKLFMFWCLYFLQESVYFIKELNIIILYSRTKDILTIYDIVSCNNLTFSEIYSFILKPSDKKVEFLFMTDKIGIDNYNPQKLKSITAPIC